MIVLNSLHDDQLVTLLKSGKVGVVPTDTIYGLAAAAGDKQAVERLYALKDREQKPGTVIAASIEQLRELGLAADVLRKVEHLLANINDYESLWRDGWQSVVAAIESFEQGRSKVVECSDISVVTLAPELFDGAGFSPTRHSAPFTAISKFAKGELFLIAIPTTSGWFYRIDYPYYSWAETVVRPHIPRRDLAPALQLLNSREPNHDAHWQPDNREMTSAVKFLDPAATLAASRLEPDEVAEVLQKSSSLAAASV